MKNIILFLIAFCGIGFTSCDEREIPLFEDANELYFDLPFVDTPRDEADTVMISFFFYKESVTELDVPLCVCLSGDLLQSPAAYSLEAITSETSLPQENYALGEYMYPVRQTMDTIIFQVYKSKRLETKVDTLTLTFEVSDYFKLGQKEYAKRVILVTAEALCPGWWNRDFSFAMLGEYTPKKMRLFVNTVSDEVEDILHFDELDPALQRKACLKFKYWLEEEKKAGRTVYEDDGREMTVNVIG